MNDKKLEDGLRPHENDGIYEYDNRLPRWWLGLFIFTIGFAVFYVLYFDLGPGPSLVDEFKAQESAIKVAQESALAASGGGASSFEEKSLQPEFIAKGKDLFGTNCMPCHGALGEGGIGPNLTDQYWLHGNTPAQIIKTISDGITDKGMVAWKGILTPEQIEQTAAFIITLKNSNPPNAKAPQGELIP